MSAGAVSVIFGGKGASFDSAISGGLPCCHMGGGVGFACACEEANAARAATPMSFFMASPPPSGRYRGTRCKTSGSASRLAPFMRIVAVHEKTVSIASPMANALIDFSRMTCSVVAIVTDAVRAGKRVIGYGFNSNGRYGQGALLRERFFPRLMEAEPRTLLDETGENLDPVRRWATPSNNDKATRHRDPPPSLSTPAI